MRRSLLTLINDILDFSKIEAGKLSLELIAFDPRLAIEESLDILARTGFFQRVEPGLFVSRGCAQKSDRRSRDGCGKS